MEESGDCSDVAGVEGFRSRGDDPAQVVADHAQLLAGEHEAATAVALANCFCCKKIYIYHLITS